MFWHHYRVYYFIPLLCGCGGLVFAFTCVWLKLSKCISSNFDYFIEMIRFYSHSEQKKEGRWYLVLWTNWVPWKFETIALFYFFHLFADSPFPHITRGWSKTKVHKLFKCQTGLCRPISRKMPWVLFHSICCDCAEFKGVLNCIMITLSQRHEVHLHPCFLYNV